MVGRSLMLGGELGGPVKKVWRVSGYPRALTTGSSALVIDSVELGLTMSMDRGGGLGVVVAMVSF
ncbi:uncharacterized protein BKA78DRAFT_318308 [Phyllosticta capitalensis]|uniref:uncharacterized protein n=1 Tax=Phyllosticta capitalensis TaxID=121624 RepID=UPI00312CE148